MLKIDRSFVGRMTDGEQPLQIVRTIIELARVLGMDVVAEGIETVEQFRLLRDLGLPASARDFCSRARWLPIRSLDS